MSNDTNGQPHDAVTDSDSQTNTQLAAELAALKSEAMPDNDGQEPDISTPAGQWEAALLDILPPVFEFVDTENDFEMTGRDYKRLAKGLAPALGKHFPDLENMVRAIQTGATVTSPPRLRILIFGQKRRFCTSSWGQRRG